MGFTDNFGHPKGFIGRLMINSMDLEHKPMATWGLQQFSISGNEEILDIGCGGGFNIQRLINKGAKGNITGFDISEECVKKARSVNKKNSNVKIIQGSVDKMPFEDESFDLVTAFETIFFWPNTAENIKEVRRVTKAGGRFVIINNYGSDKIDWEKKVPCMKRYKAEEIKSFMQEAGFQEVTIAKKESYFCVTGKA